MFGHRSHVVLVMGVLLGAAGFARADSVVFSDSVGGDPENLLYTDIIDEPLTVSQFDTMGGTRRLLSVHIVGDAWLHSEISGSITNPSSSQTATFRASVTDASSYLSGLGFTNPVGSSAATLLTYGPTNIAPGHTLTIPLTSGDLDQSGGVTLTNGLAGFIGNGQLTYLLNASATYANKVTGSGNLQNNSSVGTWGGGSVEITYNFETVAVPLPTSAAGGAGLLGVLGAGMLVRRRRNLVKGL